MNSTRVTRPVPLLLFGSTLFAIGCLGAASSQVTESGADYGVSEAVTENATTPRSAFPAWPACARFAVDALFLLRASAAPTELIMNDIQWSDGAPIYRQLKERVIAMMLDGILKPGDALPSVRQVAADYQLNPITVSRAYQELADENLVENAAAWACS